MKLRKKILIAALSLSLGVIPAFSPNLSKAASTSPTTIEQSSVKLKLNHNSYVYNNKGKRLKYYKGKKALLKKSTRLTIKGKVEPITKVKRYYTYYSDTNGNDHPGWLPYKKIKGNYYYKIGTNAYIKCINVSKINNEELQASQGTVIVKPFLEKEAHATDKNGYFINKTFKAGTKLVVDDRIMPQDGQFYYYHVKGTNYWIGAIDIKAYPRPNGLISNHLLFI
ncbi:hypothetical protein J2Z60_001519 [Lactobacillus colini]|uniref:S-layer protein C-terminal domain-containing protein n=1 Tax=Lactobacillus colini TaxID=1819254 RepID=A0ABS4MF70_9LACO|nr:SLAP domain-containing protein [Lactobacillus colini]MBP2058340.1 hypothetical protein [Lactobacillus colini]